MKVKRLWAELEAVVGAGFLGNLRGPAGEGAIRELESALEGHVLPGGFLESLRVHDGALPDSGKVVVPDFTRFYSCVEVGAAWKEAASSADQFEETDGGPVAWRRAEQGRRIELTYDDAGRLASETRRIAGLVALQRSYAYDVAGNRTEVVRSSFRCHPILACDRGPTGDSGLRVERL